MNPSLASVQRYCMFFGYPRSGHSLVGALLNAHPHALVSHELDALSLVREGMGRVELFEAIAAAERAFAERGHQNFGHRYTIEGAWQGRVERLDVIGDKKGGRSTWWLHDEPHLLDRIREVVQVPVRFLHVFRSPWDNIATITRHGHTHDDAISWYIDTCEAVASIKARIPPADVLDIRHEDFVADPVAGLTRVARFLGLDADRVWLDACAAQVRTSANRSRLELTWSSAQRDRVASAMHAFSWFSDSDLTFETDADS